MLLGTPSPNVTIHLKGMASLMRHCPPEFYATGVPHKIFISVRPILIANSFLHRKPIFLCTEEEWKSEPFRLTPASHFQSLISEASEIPALLENIDSIENSPAQLSVSIARFTITRLNNIINRLDDWVKNWQTTFSGPMSWETVCTDGRTSTWFPNFVVGTCLIHFWSYLVICMTQIRQLKTQFPSIEEGVIRINGHPPGSDQFAKSIIRMAMRILRSLDFFVQDNMNLVGVAEVSFPFHVAIDNIHMLRQHQEEQDSQPCYKYILEASRQLSKNRFKGILGFWPQTGDRVNG